MPSLWSSSHTWSCSRCDVDCVISVDLNRLVGLVVRVVREHLQKEKHRFFISRRREHREWMFQLWQRTRITHRVPPGLQQSQFPRSDRDMNRNEELMDGWMMEGEAMKSTYMDSSSLLAHRLTIEPSLSRTTMRFSLGLFSGGVISVQHQRVKQYKYCHQNSVSQNLRGPNLVWCHWTWKNIRESGFFFFF